MNFICERCEKETKFNFGVINLVCQSCGCYDIRFDSDLLLFPVIPGNDDVKGVIAKADEPFYSLHPSGSVWKTMKIPELKEEEKAEEDIEKNPVKMEAEPVEEEKEKHIPKVIRRRHKNGSYYGKVL